MLSSPQIESYYRHLEASETLSGRKVKGKLKLKGMLDNELILNVGRRTPTRISTNRESRTADSSKKENRAHPLVMDHGIVVAAHLLGRL